MIHVFFLLLLLLIVFAFKHSGLAHEIVICVLAVGALVWWAG